MYVQIQEETLKALVLATRNILRQLNDGTLASALNGESNRETAIQAFDNLETATDKVCQEANDRIPGLMAKTQLGEAA